jgi:hypothetical protein
VLRARHATQLAGAIYRLVESQEQVATNSLVRTLAEQALLEELLESSKPPLPTPAWIALPARDAIPLPAIAVRLPLRHPLRTESVLRSALRADDAGRKRVLPLRVLVGHGAATCGTAAYPAHACSGGNFDTAGTAAAPAAIRRIRRHAHASQRLCRNTGAGQAMRAAGIAAFEYRSARDPAAGINVALFTPETLARRAPAILEEWLCETDGVNVTYYSRHGGGIHVFPLQTFTVDGRLPTPAV